MIKKDSVCPYWLEDGEDELCKASYKPCTCGANVWYCDWKAERRRKDGKE